MTPLLSRGEYSITYANGVIQKKHLITQYTFESIVKPIQDVIQKHKEEKKEGDAAKMKQHLKQMVGEDWFTDNSPIHEAISAGILRLPLSQGGDQKCIVVLISK